MKKRTIGATSILATLLATIAIGCEGTDDAKTITPHAGDTRSSLLSRRAVLAAHAPGATRLDAVDAPHASGIAHTDLALPDVGPPIPLKYRAFAAAFDAERQSLGAPGAAVAILEHGELTFARGFGTKGPNSTAAVDARTLFRIGSMTKSLTAAAFLRLEDEGKVSTQERLTDFEPSVALSGPDVPKLRMKDLLSQQSGLFDYSNFGTDPAVTSESCPTDPGALQSFITGTEFGKDEFFAAPPGALFGYSNPNYVLTGAAIERVSGVPYVDAMERLFRPLGMNRTFFLASQVVADGDFADGLSTNPDGSPWDVAPGSYDCAWLRPAGYAFSSVEDYAKFMRFLYAGDPRVLSDRNRLAMQTAQVDTFLYGDTYSYGYGLFVQSGIGQPSGYYHTKTVTHGGSISGFSSNFYLLPETGFGIVTFANADNAYFYSSVELAFQSFGSLPAPTAPPASAKVEPGAFPQYAGSYFDPSGQLGEIDIVDQNGALTIAMPQLDAAQVPYSPALQPISNRNFDLTLAGQDLNLKFVPGSTGRYEWVEIDGLIATRMEPDGG